MADIPMPQSDQPTQLPVSPVEQKLHQGVVNFAKAQKLTCRNDLINLLSPCLCLGDGVEVFRGQGVKGEQMSLFSRSTELVWLLARRALCLGVGLGLHTRSEGSIQKAIPLAQGLKGRVDIMCTEAGW